MGHSMCAQLSQRLPRGVLVVVKLLRTLNQFNNKLYVYLGSFHTKYIIFRIFFQTIKKILKWKTLNVHKFSMLFWNFWLLKIQYFQHKYIINNYSTDMCQSCQGTTVWIESFSTQLSSPPTFCYGLEWTCTHQLTFHWMDVHYDSVVDEHQLS